VAIRVEEAVDASDLDATSFALVNLAALIATGGDDASYILHVGAALDAGASVDEATAVLTAIGPNHGVFKMVAPPIRSRRRSASRSLPPATPARSLRASARCALTTNG
jgi:hypothetical protein